MESVWGRRIKEKRKVKGERRSRGRIGGACNTKKSDVVSECKTPLGTHATDTPAGGIEPPE